VTPLLYNSNIIVSYQWNERTISVTHCDMDRYLHIRPTNQKPDESMTSSEPTNPRELIINEWKFGTGESH